MFSSMTNTTQGYPVFGAEPGSIDTPEWVRHAVFYQIFPDRFAKSDRVAKPAGIEPWDTDPTTHGYKGGDLHGVIERLDYLADLGINAIYLNPIFQSASNHRYHIHDYFQVDPLLGGNDAFDALLAECHARDIRVVIDGVFNHASRGFFQFNDILENGEASPWRDWFTVNSWPPNAYDHSQPAGYDAWWKLHALPEFNTDNPEVREYLMTIAEHWTRKGIDGWRLDVPEEITTEGFWAEFRRRVRAINPDAWICGEIWHDSSKWLRGDQFDGVMNYLFTSAALAFTGRDRIVKKLQQDRSYDPWPPIDGETYAGKIHRVLGLYDWNVQLAQMNLLDSHDTPRALTLAGRDSRTLELAALLMLTFPGAPTVYYGDEIGLDGGMPDKWARKTFPWDNEDRWNHELRAVYQTLIALRHRCEALRIGSYQTLAATGASYVFRRTLDDTNIIVAINSDEAEDTVLLKTALSATSPEFVIGEAPTADTEGLTIPERSAAIWVLDGQQG
jgi:glycosidase